MKKGLNVKLSGLKYPLRDVHNKLLGQKVKLVLKAEIMPIAGIMRYVNILNILNILINFN